MRNSLLPSLFFSLLGTLALTANPIITVTDTKGRTLEIELLSYVGKEVKFKRIDNSKEFTVPLTQFDGPSQTKITELATTLPMVLPPFDIEVVIGKRSEQGSSYYMKNQTVTTTVKLKNKSNTEALPALQGRMIFVGRDQRTEDDFIVLSTQEFKLEMPAGGKCDRELRPFVTSFDGDQEGRGNVGGYQYYGFLIVFMDDKNEIVYDYTTSGPIRKAVGGNKKLLAAMAAYKKDTVLDAKMVKTNKQPRIYSR